MSPSKTEQNCKFLEIKKCYSLLSMRLLFEAFTPELDPSSVALSESTFIESSLAFDLLVSVVPALFVWLH